jgi:hypothetical protein
MADNIISNNAAIAQTDSPQAPYNNLVQGLDFSTAKGGATYQLVDEPLQLLPEIHGKPSKPSYSEGQTDHSPPAKAPTDKGVPLPTPRPHDLGQVRDTKAPPAKASDSKALADKTLHVIAAADGKDFAQPSREAQAVVKQFLAEKAPLADKDKLTTLKKFGPAFDQTIKLADTAYVTAEQQAVPGIKAAKEGYIVANSNYNQTFDDTLEAAKGLPAPLQQKAAMLLAQVGINGAELPGKDELTKAFKNNPQFLDSVLGLANDQQSLFKATKALEAANKPVLDAALEQDRTRLAYERAAQSVGNQSLAKSIDAERKLVAEQTKELTDPPEELRKVLKI